MKKIALTIGIVVTSVLIALSIFVMTLLTSVSGAEKIRLEDATVTSSVSLTNMHPGDEVNKTYKITCISTGVTQITLNVGEEDALLEFLDVTVIMDGETLYEGDLQDVIGKTLEKETKKTANAVISYKLPLDVGNEAQLAAVDLKIDFLLQ